MIIYFSGNGNSKYVAESLARLLNDAKIMAIDKHLLENPRIDLNPQNEHLVWVVPVHAWGLPEIVCRLLPNLTVSDKSVPNYLVVTCGDDTGYIDKEWKKYIINLGMEPRGCWNVIMPNTFVTLPGFDVDSREVADMKLKNCESRIEDIAKAIKEKSDKTDLYRGNFPHVKSSLLRPGFLKFCMSVKPFHADEKCISCGICVKNCPLSNIRLNASGHPEWGADCTFCLGCYNRCPGHAVQYGKATAKKGQYVHK